MENLSITTQLLRMSKFPFIQRYMLKKVDSHLYTIIVEDDKRNLHSVKMRKYHFISAMMHSAMKNVRKGHISTYAIQRLNEVLVENAFFKAPEEMKQAKDAFKNKYGYDAPSFITLSPTQACNLKCTGCYASSDPHAKATLAYSVVDRLISEVHTSFGSRFITISGGEPFLYQSEGHTLIDLFDKYKDMFFLIYTNGTLITRELAHELARVGNATPAISVEGFEKETNERRGNNVHRRILEAFDNLRKEGVPFGISVTASNNNIQTLLQDKFYEYYFDQQGATYMWQFHFFPIGRGKEQFDLMLNPADRLKLYEMWEKQITEKKHCIADFWNSGVLTCGCIAYGGNRGYLYIDWNGNIMPCVFVPYYQHNIIDLYNSGKDLTYALQSDFMKNGRKWQQEYGLSNQKAPNNWLMPCSIRDHYDNFRKNILTSEVKGENQEAQEILDDPLYYKKLDSFDKELEKLSDPVWKSKYLNQP